MSQEKKPFWRRKEWEVRGEPMLLQCYPGQERQGSAKERGQLHGSRFPNNELNPGELLCCFVLSISLPSKQDDILKIGIGEGKRSYCALLLLHYSHE